MVLLCVQIVQVLARALRPQNAKANSAPWGASLNPGNGGGKRKVTNLWRPQIVSTIITNVKDESTLQNVAFVGTFNLKSIFS